MTADSGGKMAEILCQIVKIACGKVGLVLVNQSFCMYTFTGVRFGEEQSPCLV